MTYALTYEVPADEQMYQLVKDGIGPEPPEGLIVHLVVKSDGGLQHIGLWESEDDWKRFHDERVEPAVHDVLSAAGFVEMPPDPPVRELALRRRVEPGVTCPMRRIWVEPRGQARSVRSKSHVERFRSSRSIWPVRGRWRRVVR